jgi:hypothetical protein
VENEEVTAVDEKRERVAFRFFRLTKAQVDEVARLYPMADVRRARIEADKYVVSWWLQDTETYEELAGFINGALLCEEDYGLFVSLRTDYDTDIIRVPQFALNLSRRVGGVIDFSYTVV